MKIGHSKSPEHRLAEFRTVFPYRMRVLWRHGGGLPLERALHKRFEAQHREDEWFEFGDVDAVAAVTAATAELWENGALDGKKRPKRFPTAISLNGLQIAYMAPGGQASQPAWDRSPDTYQGSSQASPGARPSTTHAGGAATRLEGMASRASASACRIPRPEAIEFQGGWIVGTRLQLDAVELDRWLRQRCRAHVSPLHHMWRLPEWEPLDVARHQPNVFEEKPTGWSVRHDGARMAS